MLGKYLWNEGIMNTVMKWMRDIQLALAENKVENLKGPVIFYIIHLRGIQMYVTSKKSCLHSLESSMPNEWKKREMVWFCGAVRVTVQSTLLS